MNAAYISSGSFGSIVRSKYIGYHPYTGRRINFRSKITPIHGPVHKSDLIFHIREFTSVGYHKQFLEY